MIAKEIAAKAAQFEYELDFEVCKHTPQTWCKQAKQALQISACKQAPQNCAGQQAGPTDELQGQFSSKTCDCCR